MLIQKNFIVVPYWAHEAMRRAGLELKAILDFPTIRQALSAADLSELMLLQEDLGYLVGKPEGGFNSSALSSAWWETAKGEDETFLRNTVYAVTYDTVNRESARSRLFSPDAKRDRDEEAFITYDISPTVGAIVVYPGFFTSPSAGELQFRALEAILKVLYVYNPYYEVARTPWFRQYLMGLSVKAQAA